MKRDIAIFTVCVILSIFNVFVGYHFFYDTNKKTEKVELQDCYEHYILNKVAEYNYNAEGVRPFLTKDCLTVYMYIHSIKEYTYYRKLFNTMLYSEIKNNFPITTE